MIADTKIELEVGLTGPDWEPTAATKYYAQRGLLYAFGPTPEDALKGLKDLEASKGVEGAKEYIQTVTDTTTEALRGLAVVSLAVGLPVLAHLTYWA